MADLILEIVEGAEAGRQVPLDSIVDIGREPSLPIHLDADTQVSRRHARVSAQNGQAVVEDLGSTNGTFVNDQPIHSPRALNPGDKIRIGLTVFELRSAAQVQQRGSAVQARPDITAVDNVVLSPVPEQQLAPVGVEAPVGAVAPVAAEPQPGGQGVRGQETPPAFVPPEVVGDASAESDYAAIARLVDTRVKSQQKIAMFAMLATAALAVIIYFGVS